MAREVSCVSCHAEHRHSDLVQTTQMDDCAQCHTQLTRKDGQTPEVKVDIDTFHKGHPDFGYEVKPQSVKPVALKLNHQIHMKPGIAGPDGTVDLRCQSCHEVDAKKDGAGRYWNAPVSFEKHCQSCHQLEFDTDFPGQPAPHEKPEAVRSFVSTFYQERSADLASGLIGEKRRRTGPSGLKAEEKWKNSSNPQERLRGAERELFGRVCLECHTWDYQEGALPEVPPVEWFTSFIKKESFHHAAHRPLTCTSCHVTATKSEKTSDLLLPSMQVCQSCHQSEGLSTDQCQKCHVYHHVNPSLTDGGKVLEKFDEGSIEWKD